jgi:ABC-type dipeptide/oligopeptide/nickel transport system permease component/ABC-type dipeptide/oligopeptide/nickel transport system permease subunit
MSDLPEESSPYKTVKLQAEEPEQSEKPSPYKTVKLEAEKPEQPSPYETIKMVPEEPEESSPPEAKAPPPPPATPPSMEASNARWLHLPRRIIILLVAFGLAMTVLILLRQPLLMLTDIGPRLSREMDWSISWTTLQPVSEMLQARRPSTLTLVHLSLGLTLLLCLPTVLLALLVNTLEKRSGPLGSILKGIGKLWTALWSAAPAFCLGLILLYLLAVRLELLPLGGIASPQGTGGFRHLLLPVTTLSFLPTLLTSQVIARYITLTRDQSRRRVVLAAAFKGLGTLLGQIGGLLGASIAIESAFNLPGLGRLMVQAAMRLDLPMLLGILRNYAVLILIYRLISEIFHWLERLIHVPPVAPQPERTRWRRTARRVWVAVTLLALLLPLGALVAGLTVDPDTVAAIDTGAVGAPPSAEHPWGTDRLGRDVQARTLRGSTVTLGTTALIALAALIPGVLGGALVGYLESKERVWSEWLADILLLPSYILLFFPVVAGTLLLAVALQSPVAIAFVFLLLLLPRTTRAYQALWVSAPERRKGLMRWLAGSAAVLLGALLAGIWAVPAIEFLGYIQRPPTPSLGGMLGSNLMMILRDPQGLLIAAVFLWISGSTFYLAADGMVGFFNSKEPLARLNE